jgi:hypothetical protein
VPAGLGQFAPEKGLAALQSLLCRGAVQAMVMPANWSVFSRQYSAGARSRLLAELVQ